ncbi:MAG: hypothetical protein HY092_01620 [Candidatus Kerfeldbacteria bacterium]|nr:hypothetical protein [Candidatus Kerfeldbacteria bacterium]
MDSHDSQKATNSILDRVMQSQQSETLEHFNPLEVVNELFRQLSAKEADVLRRRFGLIKPETETLEDIGQSYHVTRERVRQIQRWAIERLKTATASKHIMHTLDTAIESILEQHGGLLAEEDLLRGLHGHVEETPMVRAATLFLLHELLGGKFSRIVSRQYKPFWKSRLVNELLLSSAIEQAKNILRQRNQPISREQLLEAMQQTPWWQEHTNELTPNAVLSYLNVATDIEHNPFHEYGLRTWGSIVPKRMNDKILLVMRKHGQPMHFQEITQRINETGFDRRQAYPPTVHNELILNQEYVLVGRGIYALKEWGYKPGVVADVIVDILKASPEPLSRDNIVEKVLTQRLVKRNTIYLALTNKSLFTRQPDGRYGLVAGPVS